MTILDSDYMMENGALGIPLAPEEEKRIVHELTKEAESNLKEGNLYYVISNRWFTSWRKYTGQDVDSYLFDKHHTDSQSLVLPKLVDRPGPIDNSDILVNGIDTEGNDLELRRTLQEGCNYILVPQPVWEKLFGWYKGGPALPRNLISQGDFNKHFNVEVFPLCLKVIDSTDNSQSIIRLSKKASLQELYQRVCALRGIEPEKARIWDYFNKTKHEILEDSEKTLENAELQMDQDILLEVQEDGFWPSQFSMDSTGNELALIPIEPSRSSVTIGGYPNLSNGHSTGYGGSFYPGSTLSSSFADTKDGYDISKAATKADRGGFAGLHNLGNTCFMNSAIQCLVHTPPFAEYFLQDYTHEINEQNPLGLHGELAVAFGELLRKLWYSGRIAIAPRAFKGKLGRFAPQFSGFNQHDSQELLAFLLDGLHEDLNRVKQKPYFETMDFDGRPDEEVADECWRHHKARNDSIIVDVCQGQYKSKLVCPVCSKISITFDPFMYLSLPLPSTVTRTMTVTVFYSDGSVLPMPYTVTVLMQGCCKDLCMALGTACCLSSDESLLLAEVYNHHIYQYLDTPLEPLSSIKDEEHLVAYRFPKKWAELTRLEICHRYLEKCLSDNLKGSQRKLFLTPLVTYLENPQTGADIDLAVSRVLSPLRKTYFGSTKINGGKENGSFSEAIDESTNSRATHNGHEYQLIHNGKHEETSSGELNFHLCITNGGFSCWPISKDSLIKPGRSVNVMLDWTNKEQELYDSSYLKDLPEVHKAGLAAKKTRQEAVSLFSCLDAFLKEEPLGPDDMWYCPSCKEHQQASKKLDLWRLPDVLVFHLKRFSYSRYLKNKLDTFVNFPIQNLDLSKYVRSKDAFGQSHVYDLYGISNHYGGLGGGHYSAYAKLIDENKWYHFDDARVSWVSEAEIKSSAAYVLFYQRVKVPNAGLGNISQDQVNP